MPQPPRHRSVPWHTNRPRPASRYGPLLVGPRPRTRTHIGLTDLIEWRNDLQSAWSPATAHPAFVPSPTNARSSWGQCGVTSFWLRHLLGDRRIVTRFVRGSLVFDRGIEPIANHCWLEHDHGGQSWIIDLTVDQTGWLEQILLEPRSCARARGLRYEGTRCLGWNELDDPTIVRRLIQLKWNLVMSQGAWSSGGASASRGTA